MEKICSLSIQDIVIAFNKKIDINSGKISSLGLNDILVSSMGDIKLKENKIGEYFLVDYDNLDTVKKSVEMGSTKSIIYNAPKDYNKTKEFNDLIKNYTIIGLYKKNEKRLYFSDIGMYSYK